MSILMNLYESIVLDAVPTVAILQKKVSLGLLSVAKTVVETPDWATFDYFYSCLHQFPVPWNQWLRQKLGYFL